MSPAASAEALARRQANQRAARLLAAATALGCGVALALVLGLGSVALRVPGAGLLVVAYLLAGVALGGCLAALAPALGRRLVLERLASVPTGPGSHPRYANLVEGLAEAAGLPAPALHVVDSATPNALTVGSGPRDAVLVATSGLLTSLNRVELEGVLAHELCHLRDGGTRLGTAAVVLGGLPGLHEDRRRRGSGPHAVLAWLTLPLAPLLGLAAPPRREVEADEAGACLTRYPPGLASALRKLAAPGSGAGELSHLGLDHLWTVAPRPPGDGFWERRYATHPPIDERLDELRDL